MLISLKQQNTCIISRILAGQHSEAVDEVDVVDETVLREIVCDGFSGVPSGTFASRQYCNEFIRILRQSLRDMQFESVETRPFRDGLSVEWKAQARLMEEATSGEPDASSVKFTGTSFYRIEGGRIVQLDLVIFHPNERPHLGSFPPVDDFECVAAH